jgi:hypothetical protein
VEVVLIATCLIAGGVGAGALVGILVRRLRGGRRGGLVFALACVGVPAVAVTSLIWRFPIVGFWDAALDGILVGAGVLWTAHRAFGRSEVLLMGLAAAGSLLLLELGCRLFLPPPPAFPTTEGPHVLLADAMRAGARLHSWDLLSKEIVCAAVYGDSYRGIVDVSGERDIVLPRAFPAEEAGHRRVLHLGDSMLFGFGVPRDATVTAALERLESDAQHINGGVPGTAPDAYLVLLRAWLARVPVDAVVMHVFEGNDLIALDDHYPCSDWQSLLVYGPQGPTLRYPTTPATPDLSHAGWIWLRYNSPPPYVLRALMGHSAAAGHLSAALLAAMSRAPLAVQQGVDAQRAHLQSILRAARDETRAKAATFTVVVIPDRARLLDPAHSGDATSIADLSRGLGIPTVDLSEPLGEALRRGADLYLPNDPHFNPAGHALVAGYLHGRLVPGTAEAARP